MAFYLVTGGAGFIGSNLSEELLKRGHKVRIIDNFSTGKEENIRDFLNDIHLVKGDIRNLDTVRGAVKGIDFCLHQAALPSVPRSVSDPISSNETNVNGTLNVLVSARDEGVKRVVLAASSSAYGNTDVLPKVETMTPDPLSPYAVTKYTGELYAKIFYFLYGLETICLRYFNIFGPKQDPASQYSAVIPKFVTAMLKNHSPVIHGDGEQSRDFTYIDNAIEANILASTSLMAGHGEVVNIACGEKITLNHLVQKLNKLLGKNIKPVYTEPRKGDVKHSFADIRLAKELLGFDVKVGFEDGLKKLLSHLSIQQ